ncbi:hypothetical protein INR49_004106 [Caranx melampygus]|nr:hypothetical protein INR49_004106 [Caranx melampygus]
MVHLCTMNTQSSPAKIDLNKNDKTRQLQQEQVKTQIKVELYNARSDLCLFHPLIAPPCDSQFVQQPSQSDDTEVMLKFPARPCVVAAGSTLSGARYLVSLVCKGQGGGGEIENVSAQPGNIQSFFFFFLNYSCSHTALELCTKLTAPLTQSHCVYSLTHLGLSVFTQYLRVDTDPESSLSFNVLDDFLLLERDRKIYECVLLQRVSRPSLSIRIRECGAQYLDSVSLCQEKQRPHWTGRHAVVWPYCSAHTPQRSPEE